MPALLPHIDRQESVPDLPLTLDGAGVRGVTRMVALAPGGHWHAHIDAQVDLAAARSGVHMSRFHEVVDAVVHGMAAEGCGAAEMAARIARAVAEAQAASTARVQIRAQGELPDVAPQSGQTTWLPITILADAVYARDSGTRTAIGVQVQGLNACPCAQDLVRHGAEQRLQAAGYDDEAIADILRHVPIATHNQRGHATLRIGTASRLEIDALARIARDAMSAPVHELLKRVDERHVVEMAHRNPRFVEDCVRSMLAGVVEAYDDVLEASDFVSVHQENDESIHVHSVTAHRNVAFGALRKEVREGAARSDAGSGGVLTLDEWLLGKH